MHKSNADEIAVQGLEQEKAELTPSRRRELAERYLPEALALVKTAKERHPNEAGELESVASEALVDAAQDFDPVAHRGQSFGTWMRRKVLGRVSAFTRSENLRKEGMGLGGQRRADYDPRGRTPLVHDDPSAGMVRAEEEAGAAEEAGLVLAGMPPECAEALRLVHGEGLTLVLAAAELGVSRATLRYRLIRGEAIARGEQVWPLVAPLPDGPNPEHGNT